MQGKKDNSSLRKQELFVIQLLIAFQKDLTGIPKRGAKEFPSTNPNQLVK